ncbi:MAG: FKBP-type peptidyl-prolyl cis-trans isomerase [Bacteroidota bacterium]
MKSNFYHILKLTLILFLFVVSCTTEGVKKKKQTLLETNTNKTTYSPATNKAELKKLSLKPLKKVSKIKLANGIKITYFLHGNGEVLKDGEVVQINYEVLLDDNTFVDGNKLLNRETLPFLVGYGMQTPGWDIAFRKLKVGDFVEIYLPAKFARGEVGIKGLIPPNANNRIRVKVVEKVKPTKEIDGTKVWLLEQNKSEKKLANEESEIEFHYMVGTASNPKYDISYKRNQPFKFRFSDFGIVKGLKKSLINAKRSDKIWVLIPPSEAYGEKGLMDIVKSNEHVFYDIFVMDVR